jgi:hypothetical protein
VSVILGEASAQLPQPILQAAGRYSEPKFWNRLLEHRHRVIMKIHCDHDVDGQVDDLDMSFAQMWHLTDTIHNIERFLG